MKFIRQFASDVDYQSFIGGGDNYVEPHIALIKDTYSVVYKRKLTQPLITQTINLTGTYNWVSFYLDTLEGENGLKLLQQSLGNNATKISTSTNADGEHNLISTYNQSTGTWDGNLTSINLKSSYQITCTNPTTIEFDGYAVDYQLPLPKGRGLMNE